MYKTRKRFLLITLALAGVFFLGGNLIVNAAPDLVTDPETIVSGGDGSDVFAVIAKERDGNFLEAPVSYVRLSFTQPAGNSFRMGFCNSNANVVCRGEEWNNVLVNARLLNGESEDTGQNGFRQILKPQPGFGYSLPNAPDESYKSPVNGRYNYILAIRFINENDANFPANIPFRVRAVGGGARAGFAKNLNRGLPLAVQNRNNSNLTRRPVTHTDTIKIRMRVPCTLSNTEQREFSFLWKDADAKPGSRPDNSNPQINWRLTIRSGSTNSVKRTLSASQYASREGKSLRNYLGGQNESGGQVFARGAGNLQVPYEPGDVLEWEWQSVLANNGVQVLIPFDDASVSTNCPPPPSGYAGTCDVLTVNNQPTSGEIILNAGQRFNAELRIRNTGRSGWDLTDGSRDRVVISGQTRAWLGDNDISLNGRGNTLGGAALSNGGQISPLRTPEYTVPSSAAVGQAYSITWAVYKYGETQPIINTCSATVLIKGNKPFLRASGGDTLVGAVISDDGSCSVRDKARVANIDTNGFYEQNEGVASGSALDGSSSSQYAVFTSGLVGSIETAGNNFSANNVYTRESRKDLLFANTQLNNGGYGQYYGSSDLNIPCVDSSEYIKSAVSSPPGVSLQSFISNQYEQAHVRYEGSQAITNQSFTVQGRKIAVINGDLRISSNIKYIDSYGSIAQIPNLTVVVLGNIYIEDGVTEIDGTYIAVPVGDSGGLVDTCSNVLGAGVRPDGGSRQLTINACPNKLSVNGRLVAQEVIWKRTYGTIGTNRSTLTSGGCVVNPGGSLTANALVGRLDECAAEFINFSPEAYFNTVRSNRSSSSIGDVPSSSVELPPIY